MRYPVHLNSLRAFEAAARHLSFADAAKELNVTPAAIGQHIRGLEERLGLPLFARAHAGQTRLTLTSAARAALADISAGLERLNVGLERLRGASANGVLTVTVSPAFAAKWLMQRIERFQSAHPGVSVRIDTNLRIVDFALEGVDIGVRYGAGKWPDLESIKLLDEEIYPVCSPSLVEGKNPLRTPSVLKRHTLIHDVSLPAGLGFPTWATWLSGVGLGQLEMRGGLQINNSAAVIQAAINGQGVALGRSVMVADDLAQGRLVRPFEVSAAPNPLAYYIVYRAEAESSPRVLAFRDWLITEAAVTARH